LERQILSSPSMRELLNRNRIQLIPYRALAVSAIP
jgi:hypothetical protein